MPARPRLKGRRAAGDRPEAPARDQPSERWIYLSFVVPLMLLMSVGLALEWFTVWNWAATQGPTEPFTRANLFGIWSFALIPALIGAAAIVPFYPAKQPWTWRVLVAAAFSFMSSALRVGVVWAIWGTAFRFGPIGLEVILSFFVPFSCITISMYYANSQVRAGAAQRRLAELEFRARQGALERENAELKVRRELSSVLHDHLQQRLVYAASRLQTEILPIALEHDDELATSLLEEIIGDIDRLRENDVRQLSHSLFPLGADLGLHQAIALTLGRVPASVKVSLSTSQAAAAFDTILDPKWDVGSRAVLAEVLDESITNALKHGGATSIWVNLDIEVVNRDEVMVLTVANDGLPVRPDARLSGLANHRIRAQLRGGGLNLGVDEDGYTRVVAWLPLIPVHTVPGPEAAPAAPPPPQPASVDDAVAPAPAPPAPAEEASASAPVGLFSVDDAVPPAPAPPASADDALGQAPEPRPETEAADGRSVSA
ncbi:MAG: hypothetical protein LBD90_02195 [Bifidobacteriaceae bacterium]|nr:hypothetical protein [Bifidobacteriaceae bacterium]